MQTDYLNHYVSFYQSLSEQEIPNLEYNENQNNLKIFIDYFPEFNWNFEKDFRKQLQKYIPTALDYIKTFKFLSPNLSKLFSLVTDEKISELVEIAEKHYTDLLTIISTPKNEREKKRIYLGILWFLIGYYICQVIAKITKTSGFPSMLLSAKNRWVLFLTSCFIFYDDIFDIEEIPERAKKECLGFTKFFFQYVLETALEETYNYKETISEIREKYAKLKNITFEYLEIMTNVEKVLDVCWQEILKNLENKKSASYLNKNQLRDMVSNIQDLFLTEVRISKLQKQNLETEEKLKLMLEKSQKSIMVIWRTLLPGGLIGKNILNLTYRFSFLSQLLDDLNDREIDIVDGNHTIFTVSNCIPEIKKTLLYILDIRKYLEKEKEKDKNIKDMWILSNHLANMFVFNYALGKQKSIVDMIPECIRKSLFMDSSNILKIRSKKLKYQKIIGYFSFK